MLSPRGYPYPDGGFPHPFIGWTVSIRGAGEYDRTAHGFALLQLQRVHCGGDSENVADATAGLLPSPDPPA